MSLNIHHQLRLNVLLLRSVIIFISADSFYSAVISYFLLSFSVRVMSMGMDGRQNMDLYL